MVQRYYAIGQAYDANANMLSSPAGQTLSYYVENRLASALSSSSEMKYAYDGQNKRVWSCTYDQSAAQCTAQTVYFYVPDGGLLSQITPNYMPASVGHNGGGRVPPSLQLVAYMARQYFGGRLLANEDRLSSRCRYYPYGEDRPPSGQQNPGDGSVTFAT